MSEQFLRKINPEEEPVNNAETIESLRESNDRHEEREIKMVHEVVHAARDKKPGSLRMILGAVLALAPLTSLACVAEGGGVPRSDTKLEKIHDATKPMPPKHAEHNQEENVTPQQRMVNEYYSKPEAQSGSNDEVARPEYSAQEQEPERRQPVTINSVLTGVKHGIVTSIKQQSEYARTQPSIVTEQYYHQDTASFGAEAHVSFPGSRVGYSRYASQTSQTYHYKEQGIFDKETHHNKPHQQNQQNSNQQSGQQGNQHNQGGKHHK
jgi:hypothetical protein